MFVFIDTVLRLRIHRYQNRKNPAFDQPRLIRKTGADATKQPPDTNDTSLQQSTTTSIAFEASRL